MTEISWAQFAAVELRVGTIVAVEHFPEARKPAYKISVDFGAEFGVRRTSAQFTQLYRPDELLGRQVVGVINLPAKQIGPVRSEFLLTGADDGAGGISLIRPDHPVPNGMRIT